MLPLLPYQRPRGASLADLVDFVDCGRFYACRRDWSHHRDALAEAVERIENEVFLLSAARWPDLGET